MHTIPSSQDKGTYYMKAIEEIRSAKRKAELTINNAILEFQETTGVPEVDIQTIVAGHSTFSDDSKQTRIAVKLIISI